MDGYEYLYISCDVCNILMLIDQTPGEYEYTHHEDHGTICMECLNSLQDIE